MEVLIAATNFSENEIINVQQAYLTTNGKTYSNCTLITSFKCHPLSFFVGFQKNLFVKSKREDLFIRVPTNHVPVFCGKKRMQQVLSHHSYSVIISTGCMVEKKQQQKIVGYSGFLSRESKLHSSETQMERNLTEPLTILVKQLKVNQSNFHTDF